jgi:hypothetical protein
MTLANSKKTFKMSGSTSDLPSSVATLRRTTKLNDSYDLPPPTVTSTVLSKTSKVPEGSLSISNEHRQLHESRSASSFLLLRSNSEDASRGSSTGGPAADQLSKSAHFERGSIEPYEAVKSGAQIKHCSDGEEDNGDSGDDSSTAAALTSDGEDEDEDETIVKLRRRPQLRDERGRLTIVASIDEKLAKATSMLALNQIGSGSATLPRGGNRSLTTDDIAFGLKTGALRTGKAEGALPRYVKKSTNHGRPGAGDGVSMRAGNRSPKSGRTAPPNSLAINFQTVEERDAEVRRSDYLTLSPRFASIAAMTTATATTMTNPPPTPSVVADRLLRRSLLADSSNTAALLAAETAAWLGPSAETFSLMERANGSGSNSSSGVDNGAGRTSPKLQRETARSTAAKNKFDTFRGAIKPMRWSESDNDMVPHTVVARHSATARGRYSDVPKIRQRLSIPPEWIVIKPPSQSTTASPSTTTTTTMATTTPSKSSVSSGAHRCDEDWLTAISALKADTLPRPKTAPVNQSRRMNEVTKEDYNYIFVLYNCMLLLAIYTSVVSRRGPNGNLLCANQRTCFTFWCGSRQNRLCVRYGYTGNDILH